MNKMNRMDLTRLILARIGDGPVVASLGNTSFDLFEAGDRPQNFYVLGSMGLASSLGLGLAMAQPDRRIVVLEGEGGTLMNLGILASIGWRAPKNYILIVWDNEQFQITGGQPIATSLTNLAHVAKAAGIANAYMPEDREEFATLFDQALHEDGPWVIVAKVDGAGASRQYRPDPTWIKHRFMEALGTGE
jgi:thiamine pyrophosphate-dependent acetolactate synthase large subunit-like protein